MRIYLDFDGCLHRAGRDKVMFEHMEALETILREHPHTHVVISSSWREEHSFDEMRSYFAADVQRQIIGVTPVLPGATRHAEILQHVQSTGYDGDYIVLDDDSSEFPPGWPQLLLCDPTQGFDVEKQGELRRMLSERQKNVLLMLSTGEISLIEATPNLGYTDTEHTLRALADAGLAMPKLSEEVLQAQGAASLEALRTSLIAGEEARLAEKLYELGKMQPMVYGRDGKSWKQTPAGTRGLYFVRRVRST
jgi:hypothetical protein